MNTWKQTLFSNWHFMRWIQLSLGTFLAIDAIQSQAWFTGTLAVFFLFQALSNTGCCGVNTCVPKKEEQENKE